VQLVAVLFGTFCGDLIRRMFQFLAEDAEAGFF